MNKEGRTIIILEQSTQRVNDGCHLGVIRLCVIGREPCVLCLSRYYEKRLLCEMCNTIGLRVSSLMLKRISGCDLYIRS